MTKRFGAFTALDDVALKVRPGSFHALLGENGAGKSTLVKCIMGYYHADRGRASLVDGREQAIANPQRRARARHRHGLPALHAGAGDDGGREPGAGARRRAGGRSTGRRRRKALEAFLARMPFQVPLDAGVRPRRRREAEARDPEAALSRAALPDPRRADLGADAAARPTRCSGMLRGMVAAGELTILMITHKFREVMAFADEVTVLRRGKLAGARPGRRAHARRDGAHDDRRRAS